MTSRSWNLNLLNPMKKARTAAETAATFPPARANAAAVVGPSANIYLRNMIRMRRYPGPQGIFLDRRLTAAELERIRARMPTPKMFG